VQCAYTLQPFNSRITQITLTPYTNHISIPSFIMDTDTDDQEGQSRDDRPLKRRPDDPKGQACDKRPQKKTISKSTGTRHQ
jgi:hypothetical protein